MPNESITDEQKVKAVYPDAYVAGDYSTIGHAQDAFDVVIRSTGKTAGSGHTPKKAWADASSRLPPAPIAAKETKLMSGVELIQAERLRQMRDKGWTSKHDDEHVYGELVKRAAALAVLHTSATVIDDGEEVIPWETHPTPRSLVIVGALIAAEIDRLQRLSNPTPSVQKEMKS